MLRHILAGLILSVLAARVSLAAAPAALVTYDLSGQLNIDVSDPGARRRIWDVEHVVAALQGLVNRDEPRLYVFLVGPGGRIDHYWLDKLRAPGQWLAGTRVEPETDLLSLLKRFRSFYKGVAVYDERVPATALVASTVAGCDDLLPVRYDADASSLYQRMVNDPAGPRLPVVVRLLNDDGSPMFTGKTSGSAKADATLWAVDHYLKSGKCDPTRLGYYPDAYWLTGKTKAAAGSTLLSNHDYFIAHRAFFFDVSPWADEAPDDDRRQPLGTDPRTLQAVLRAAYDRVTALHPEGAMIHVGGFTPWDQKYTDYTGGKHGGVPTEWKFAETLTAYNAYMDADAPGLYAMANASVFQHFPLKERYPQPNLPTDATLRARGLLSADGTVAPRNYAALYVGDYDSAAWLYQKLPGNWDDPNRGAVPLGWAFDPGLADRFPVGMAMTRATATANDFFVAGDSGYGYVNPTNLVPPRKPSGLASALPAWERLCAAGYRRWDLGITGFVINGNTPAMPPEVRRVYARFSPAGVVEQYLRAPALVDGTPFLAMSDDLSNVADGFDRISRHFPASPAEPRFAIFRTILWTPTQHKELAERLKRERPDVDVVDPYTLMLLLKHRLAGAGGPSRP